MKEDFEARFFNNRFGIDFTYYVRNTKDDIVNAGISTASGYGNVKINAGKVNNHGIELLLTGTPILSSHFRWDTSFNFAYNKSEIKRITDDVTEFELAKSRTGHDSDNCGPAWIYQQVGQPYGIIRGVTFKRNDKGEIMQGTKPIDADIYAETGIKGGAVNIPTTNIKLWIDPNNGKYLGKYDEFEFKGDGILYGKSDGGKNVVPLYKLAIMNFHNPEGLYEIKQGQFIETEESGRPVIGRGEVRGGLLEMSNCDFKANISYYQQAKMQMDVANKLIQTNKSLLQEVLQLISS